MPEGIDSLGDDGSPVVLRWPAERLVAEQLAKRGVPRLLLVDTESDPPVSLGLEIKTVRGRGYVLQVAPATPADGDSHR